MNSRQNINRRTWAGWTGAALIAAAVLATSGCQTVERVKEAISPEPLPAKPAATQEPVAARKAPAPAPIAPAPRAPGEAALEEGIALYEKGEFNAAIRRLNAPEINAADINARTTALKYKAFSYCVTSRQTLCRQQFQKAFKLDPAFDLAAGEQGHPMWAAAFQRAKRGK